MADMMDKTINSIITALIAVVLIAAAFIPTVLPLITSASIPTEFQSLLKVVVTFTIIGVLIGVIKMYQGKNSGEGER